MVWEILYVILCSLRNIVIDFNPRLVLIQPSDLNWGTLHNRKEEEVLQQRLVMSYSAVYLCVCDKDQAHSTQIFLYVFLLDH